MKKSFYKLSLAIFTILTVLFISFSLTFSWFIKTNESTFVIQTGDLASSIVVAFDGSVVNSTSPYYDSAKKVVLIDGGNTASANSIEKLTVSLTITPQVSARFRIKIQDEWRLKRTYYSLGITIEEAISHENSANIPGNIEYPFTIANIANYIYDSQTGYLYYNVILNKGQTYNISFITAGLDCPVFSNSVFFEECIVYLDLIVDVVQANRFSEVWGISPDYFG
ncbi:MAG: hypothetical protein AB7V00_03730 [Bacilli bacterium]